MLHEAAQRMRAATRPYDAIGRYGGEEFLIVLPGCDSSTAMNVTKRICAQMRAVPVTTPQCSITVTVSIGVAVCPVGNEKAVNELVDEADAALYQAKNSGRNQAILAQAVEKG